MTQPFYESRVNWVIDPELPASRRPVLEASSAPTPAHSMPPSGDVSQPPRRQKSRRRRRRKAARPASQLPASRQADVTTQADPTANDNSACGRATRPRSCCCCWCIQPALFAGTGHFLDRPVGDTVTKNFVSQWVRKFEEF